MYERFTDRARKVIQIANQEARRYNHEYVGTEHVLLGLITEDSGVASIVLKELGVNRDKVRQEIEKLVGSGHEIVTVGKLLMTPRAKKVIDYAVEEARNLGQSFIGTEHLLLGILLVKKDIAYQVLTNLGLDLEGLRAKALGLTLNSQKSEFRQLPQEVRQLGENIFFLKPNLTFNDQQPQLQQAIIQSLTNLLRGLKDASIIIIGEKRE